MHKTIDELENWFTMNLPNQTKFVVAISGGIDSVVLTHLMWRLKQKLPNLTIVLVHVNHQLRGACSNEDEAFCKQFADELSLPIHVVRKSLPTKKNLQANARRVRFAALTEISQKINISTFLLAHHKDDLIETFFIRLLRPGKPENSAGLENVKQFIINSNHLTIAHPLLNWSRVEIQAYQNEYNLKYREDHTNSETNYLRNRIRHYLIPQFSKCKEDWQENLMVSINRLSETKELIQQSVYQLFLQYAIFHNNAYYLSFNSLSSFNSETRRRLIKYSLQEFSNKIQLNQAELNIINDCIFNETRNGCRLLLTKNSLEIWREWNYLAIVRNNNINLDDFSIELDKTTFDLDKATVIQRSQLNELYLPQNVNPELTLRFANAKEIIILNPKGQKFVDIILQEQKVPVRNRNKCLGLYTKNNELIAIQIHKFLSNQYWRISSQYYCKENQPCWKILIKNTSKGI